MTRVGPVRLAGLGEVGLVAAPGAAAFDAGAGVQVVGVEDQQLARWQAGLLVPPAHLAAVAVELLDPGRPQYLHRLQVGQPRRRVRAVDRLQQHQAVPANLNGPLGAGLLGLGQPPVVTALTVAAGPLGRDQPSKPRWRHHRQGLQGGAEGLDDLFQPVQVTHGQVDVGGVGALAPAPAQQATLTQPTRA